MGSDLGFLVGELPPFHISGLLMKPVLASSESQWLEYFAMFQAHWWYLSLSFQHVSGYIFLPADNADSGLFSLWEAMCIVVF